MRKRFVAVAATLVAASLAWPVGAQAHGLIQRANLPIPEWLFGWAAAVVLVVSFVALAVLWPTPQIDGNDGWRPLRRVGRLLGSQTLEDACQTVGTALFVLVLVAGFFGRQDVEHNIAPTFVFITFWVGLAFASVLFGDVFRAFNPWRAIGRATGAVLGGRPERRRRYPDWLGRWPAAAGLLGFAWLELASSGLSQVPHIVAIAAAVYSAFTFAAMAVFGVEVWSDRGEAFSVYFNLFSRLSIFERRDGVVGIRPPLSGLTRLERLPGTVGVIIVMIGTVTYDGLEQGQLWARLALHVQDAFNGLGFSDITVERLTSTVGIALAVGAVALFYNLGVLGARSVGGEQTVERLRIGFVHSLVPIAMVYVAAHYFTFLVVEGQGVFSLASDPLGHDWNLFGTASRAINYGVITQNQTWYAQVVFIVAGHVAALLLAHERSLVLYNRARLAVRSQYWMLAVMVGFTTLALWLLAEAGTASNVSEAAAKGSAVSSRLVDFSKKPPFVNGLERDPKTGDFLLTTNRGFWRIDPESNAVKQIRGKITYHGKSDTVGTFLAVDALTPTHYIGSGHPDHQNTLPQFLGYIESFDAGRTWHALSRVGDADLHKILFNGRRMFAYDAVLSAVLTSDDLGRHFVEHFTPRGLMLDLVVDPDDRDYLLIDNDTQLFRSTDGGNDWKPVLTAKRVRMAWPAHDSLYRADQDGTVFVSSDRGVSWKKVSKVDGEPYKFETTSDPRHLYLALSDGKIVETRDGAQSWTTAFQP